MSNIRSPFVLLEDRGPGGRTLLYEHPHERVQTRDPGEVRACLARLHPTGGHHLAGFLAYEAGLSLEPRLSPLASPPGPDEEPLLWFGVFDPPAEVDPESWLPDPKGAWCGAPHPLVAERDYRTAVEEVLAHIRAGNIYQANLTFQTLIPVAGDPRALYAALRRRASAGFAALLFTGQHWILSLSPELFFTLADGKVTTRPMKGTAPAGSDPAALREDPKQRAENLMIVDLLRNDLSRLARPGTVQVPSLFDIETYPTLLQMTSTITAELEPGRTAADLLAATFPCGSITGAPKIRAMEIIHELERHRRGVYCGAIGRVAPNGEAAFNVAIRTLVLRGGENQARLGLGSGIVADSDPGDEWRECVTKGAFVEEQRRFDLLETMAFDPHEGLNELDLHLERLKKSAETLDFKFDRHVARNELQAATFRAGPSFVRLRLSRTGALAIELRDLPPRPKEPVDVAVAPLPVAPGDFRLAFKTSDRSFYDEARQRTGAFETIFTDPSGFLTEGSFTSLFVEREGRLLTPPLTRGLLPGILRQKLLEEGRAAEQDLTLADLQPGFLIGNSIRGLLRARLAAPA